jgi:Calcineurin-like phosphoesterase
MKEILAVLRFIFVLFAVRFLASGARSYRFPRPTMRPLVLKHNFLLWLTVVLVSGSLLALPCVRRVTAQQLERVSAIAVPATPLPPEAQSRDVKKFSFIAYGDTRGRRDGIAAQYEHSLIVDAMITQIKQLKNTEYPVRFVLQSGDAVVNGGDAHQWNVSFVPLINRLTTEGGVPYFLVPGNHDVTSALTVDAPERQARLRNYLDAVAALIPPDGSPRRLAGYPTYAFGYGNTFVLGLDANIAGDEKQYQWAKVQLEGLDRSRYVNVIIFCHQAPFSSGPHGGSKVEQSTTELRKRYMPLFQAHHVRAVFSGHEHLFEHWVEHYTDGTGRHRMDLVVSGGGGAPLYGYRGEPDLRDYLKANESSEVTLEHLVRPGVDRGSSPYHYVVVRVDGDRLEMEVFGVDWGVGFQPYRSSKVELLDL